MALIRDARTGLRLEWIDEDDDAHGAGRPVEEQFGPLDARLEPKLAAELTRYFSGKVADFSFVETPDGPPFFRACWEACRSIPRGTTISYGELAAAAGSAKASRAAGQAMRNNPLPIVVPCHRVVASDGTLHGFGGWRDPASRALGRKAQLLSLEGAADRAIPGGIGPRS